MAKSDELLIRVAESLARMESKLEQWGNLPSRVDLVEEKHTILSTEIKTTKNVLWTVLLSIPLVVGLLTLIGLEPNHHKSEFRQ